MRNVRQGSIRREIMRAKDSVVSSLIISAFALAYGAAAQEHTPAPAAGTGTAAGLELSLIPLPGAPPDGVFLDYLAVDRPHHRVWVPAGGTGRVDVIDTNTHELHPIENFPTSEVERQGKKRTVGPSSATVGNGFVYVGNRADSSVCAVDAMTLARGGCVTIPASPDGVAYVASTREVWVTTPRTNSMHILDVSTPSAPKLAGNFTLEGQPEGYAVDETHGAFYTNLEDKDRTLRIDLKTHRVTSTWLPACGEDGPKGLAIEPADQLLVVACPDHIEVMDAGKDGRILSKLDTGAGVDNIDYLPSTRSLYVAAGRAATITIAHLDQKGALAQTGARATTRGARNAVVTDEGIAYVADGPEGKILVVTPAH
jgi:DNA-binding beta-propeller fold protein YncE